MSGKLIKKWDIVFAKRFPESLKCTKCQGYYDVSDTQICTHCSSPNRFTELMIKRRPIIVWKSQISWVESMAFGIPLSSTTKWGSGLFSVGLQITDCSFISNSSDIAKPRRANICQSTRLDGNTLISTRKFGVVTNLVIRDEIENKLLSWIFDE